MSLSSELISQFVKITNDKTEQKKETTVYGKVVKYNGKNYVQLDGSDHFTPMTTTVDAKPGERVAVLIKNHTATVTGNISSPSARTDDVKEIALDKEEMSAKITEFEIAIGDKVDVSELNAANARIDILSADNVNIKQSLSARDADIDNLQVNVIDIQSTLTAHDADIKKLKADILSAEIADITYATIESLNATNSNVHNLEVTYGNFANLTAKELDAHSADIEKLQTDKLDASTANITYAKIADLNADKADIDNLQSSMANINTLIFGSASGSVIHSSFANAVIAQLGNAQIKSAMIESISADKIIAGDIVTNDVRVMSEDGNLVISDETMQISDGTRVRVQIGKDATDDYSINVWDVNGNLMFSKGGITDKAIKDAIIRNDMISDTANIEARKLDIDSLFEEINGSSKTIKSSKIYLDDKNQTLDVAFESMSTDLDDLGATVTSQGSQITVIQSQINSKVWKQDINEATNTLNTQYSALDQKVDGISATVASHTTEIDNKADNSTVTTVTNRVASLESNLSGFQSTVSNTYATKTEHNNTKNIATQAFDKTNLQSDVTNYAQLNDATASKWGFTADNTADGHWYTIDVLSRDKFISDWHECVGNERFRISFEISTSCKGSTSNGGTDSEFRGTAIGIYGYDASGKSAGISYSDRIMATEDAPVKSVSSIVTVHSNARKFRVFVQTESWGNFSGTIKIRNVRVEKIDRILENDISINRTNIQQTDNRVTAAVERISNNEASIASLEVTADGLTSRVSTTEHNVSTVTTLANQAKSEIDNLEIGGRNLYENSANLTVDSIGRYFAPETPPYTVTSEEDPQTPSGKCLICAIGEIGTPLTNGGFYLNAAFGNYIPKMIEGEMYTVSVWIKCSRNISMAALRAEFLAQQENINMPNISTEWQRYIIRGIYNGNTTSSVAITFYYNSLITSNDIFYVSSPMIEKGNRASDWVKAPEDMATSDELASVQSTVDLAEERVTTAESLIQQLSDCISTLVTDGNGESLMTQTANGWTFSTKQLQDVVNETSEGLDNLINDVGDMNSAVDILKRSVTELGILNDYVKITTYENEPCIELGETDSDFKLLITNTRIMFKEGASVPAYINNQSLFIKKAVIEEELEQGSFIWKARANGNLGLIWKGGE